MWRGLKLTCEPRHGARGSRGSAPDPDVEGIETLVGIFTRACVHDCRSAPDPDVEGIETLTERYPERENKHGALLTPMWRGLKQNMSHSLHL